MLITLLSPKYRLNSLKCSLCVTHICPFFWLLKLIPSFLSISSKVFVCLFLFCFQFFVSFSYSSISQRFEKTFVKIQFVNSQSWVHGEPTIYLNVLNQAIKTFHEWMFLDHMKGSLFPHP